MTEPFRPPTPGGRLGAVAPVPFVGVATILVALIVFTPVLLAPGPSPLAVQAELSVYRTLGSPTTEFYVHGIDPVVPYRWVNLSLGSGFPWTGSCPTTPLNWSYTNETNETVSNVVSGADPVVVNATLVYLQGGTRVLYAGEMAFHVVNRGSASEGLAIAPCPWTPGLSPPTSWAVSNLPLGLLLVDYGTGGP
jgi:hypothetical protein